MPPPANERRNARQGRYNRLHDLEMANRHWLEEQGLPEENNEVRLPSVNDNIRHQELERERERRARIRRRRANPNANRQPTQSNAVPLTSEEIQTQRNLAAEWARSQGWLRDNPPNTERAMGGKKIKSRKHSRKMKSKKHSRKMKSKKHSRKH
jgi:hypothetical protein